LGVEYLAVCLGGANTGGPIAGGRKASEDNALSVMTIAKENATLVEVGVSLASHEPTGAENEPEVGAHVREDGYLAYRFGVRLELNGEKGHVLLDTRNVLRAAIIAVNVHVVGIIHGGELAPVHLGPRNGGVKCATIIKKDGGRATGVGDSGG